MSRRHPPTDGERIEALRLLGLPRVAPPALVRQRYRALARECHPDHHPDDPEKTARFRLIATAYETLTFSPESLAEDVGTGPSRPTGRVDDTWWDRFGHLV